MRDALIAGYRARDLRRDLTAGVIVGIVALPLSMALAIASGVPPQHGLYTAIVAGAVISLLGGSAVQVSGPTAAFVALLAPVSAKFGVSGLMLASFIAGGLLCIMAVARLGRLIEFIPYPVTSGFTAGIAVVIATLQVKDFLGLEIPKMPEHFVERVGALAQALPTVHVWDVAIGVLTLAILVFLPRLTRQVPAPLVALAVAGLLGFGLDATLESFDVATINSRFSGIPRSLPVPQAPWIFGADSGLSPAAFRELLGAALAIAMLGAIESLLSAVVADGMLRTRHNPDSELFAQGVGNMVAPLFGGFAATGAIARTATNIRSGGRTPIAAFTHAVFILAAMLTLAPVLGYLPMASLAALLLVVAWNMSEAKHVLHVLRVAPRSDVIVLAVCFLLTVLVDMVAAVSVGVVLAALLFMQRMAGVSRVTLVGEGHPALPEALPKGVLLYQVAGPLFFGAAHKAMSALGTVARDVRVVIIDMTAVPTMDATGLINLESTLDKLRQQHIFVVIAGVQNQPLNLMAKAGWKHRPWLVIWRSFEDAMALARSLSESDLADPQAALGEVRAASAPASLH